EATRQPAETGAAVAPATMPRPAASGRSVHAPSAQTGSVARRLPAAPHRHRAAAPSAPRTRVVDVLPHEFSNAGSVITAPRVQEPGERAVRPPHRRAPAPLPGSNDTPAVSVPSAAGAGAIEIVLVSLLLACSAAVSRRLRPVSDAVGGRAHLLILDRPG